MLFLGIPLTTWGKAIARRGGNARWVVYALPVGAFVTFVFAAWNGLDELSRRAVTDAASRAAAQADAVAVAVNAGTFAVVATIAIAVLLLGVSEVQVRRRG